MVYMAGYCDWPLRVEGLSPMTRRSCMSQQSASLEEDPEPQMTSKSWLTSWFQQRKNWAEDPTNPCPDFWPMCVHACSVTSVMSNTVQPVTIAPQAPLSMGILQARILSGLPFPPPGDLPYPEIEPTSLMFPALAGRFFTTRATWKVQDWDNECVVLIH